MSQAKNNNKNNNSNSPIQKQADNNNDEAIKLFYCSSGAGGWTLARSPVPHLLAQAGVPESVWCTTYDAAVIQQAAFGRLNKWSWKNVMAQASYCCTLKVELLNAWIKVVHEQQVVYAFHGIKVLFLQTLVPAPGRLIIGGLLFRAAGIQTPRTVCAHNNEPHSFVQELEVLYRLHQSGGLTDEEYALAKQQVIHSNNSGESVAVPVTHAQAGIIICPEETQELTTGSNGDETAKLL